MKTFVSLIVATLAVVAAYLVVRAVANKTTDPSSGPRRAEGIEAAGILRAGPGTPRMADPPPASGGRPAARRSTVKWLTAPIQMPSEPLEPPIQEMMAELANPAIDPMAAAFLLPKLAREGRGDERVGLAIIGYFQRLVEWRPPSDRRGVLVQFSAKNAALPALGTVGTPGAEMYLRYLMSPEGAREETQGWLGNMPDWRTNEDGPSAIFRGRAAVGLSRFSEKPEIRNLISSDYATERRRLVEAGRLGGAYFSQLCDAMVNMDMIRDFGLDLFLKLTEDPDFYVETALQYLERGGYSLVPRDGPARFTLER
jgi:hypothetical protein